MLSQNHRNNAHQNMHHPCSDYSIYPHNPRHMHQQNAHATINPHQAPNNSPMPARQITKPQRLSQGTSQSPAIFQLLLIICEQNRHCQSKNVIQGSQTPPLLWLLCASSSELIHPNLLSYIDDIDNIQHGESINYHRAHTHSQ